MKSAQASPKKAWVISVDMGYGHQRAAYALTNIVNDHIINLNIDDLTSRREKKIWKRALYFYNWISRMRNFPLIGKTLFDIFDKIQAIKPFFPFKDLSKPDATTRWVQSMIKTGLCKSVFDHIKKTAPDMPVISTFPVAHHAGNYLGFKKVFCILTDSDVARPWIPLDSKHNNVTFFASTEHTARRVRMYGVPEKQVVVSGFPLPPELLGGRDLPITKADLGNRLPNLDPNNRFRSAFKDTLTKTLGAKNFKSKSDHPLTLMFAIGGAGAQLDIGLAILDHLSKELKSNKLRIIYSTGIRKELNDAITAEAKKLKLDALLNKNILFSYAKTKTDYFVEFSKSLHKTDILWTKPSELVFYAGLGLPIIIAPPIGSHEVYNRDWLLNHGAGILQCDTKVVSEWLAWWINDGQFAEMAFNGFAHMPNKGTYIIEDIVTRK